MSVSRQSALWDFAVGLYSKPDISEACLTLQDEYGVDVVLLLYAAWIGTAGIALSASDAADIGEIAGQWQREIVVPLRVIRRRLKEGPSPAPGERTDKLRNAIKSAELSAERIEVELLEGQGRHLAAPDGGTAAANMMTVVTHCSGSGRDAGERSSALVQAVAAAIGS